MNCLICGTSPTIKSHLMPKAMAQEVQTGKAHAVAKKPDDYVYTQSGIFEREILCANCDNKLGHFENIAVKAFREMRIDAKNINNGEYTLKGTAGDDILRFAAGILWKYSVASEKNGRINLGPYKKILEGIIFNGDPIPSSIDAMIIRLKTHKSDDGVFAYRLPSPDRQELVNGYRLLVGGMFVFIKIDKQSPQGGALKRCSIRGKSELRYAVMPAQNFEEYQIADKLAHSGQLSSFLDKQDT
ncbi:hypothetical protein [Pseudomonas viridiflava]|uniref:hypothetical protein n=1 Tax=Pseudomonas viridiflava TaxID=33069 RepID=UPI0013036E49|nr:hypothetical protein [Pseudomonas viridiflava]